MIAIAFSVNAAWRLITSRTRHPVGRAVGDVHAEGPALIAPVAAGG